MIRNGIGEIRILDLETGKSSEVLIRVYEFRHLRVMPDGKSLAFLGRETTIRPLDKLDRPTFSLRVPFTPPSRPVTPDGRFDPNPPKPVGPGTAVPQLSPDGKHVFAHDENSDIGIWGTDSGNRNRTIDGNGRPVERLILSPDGKRLLVFTDKDFTCWDVPAGKRLFKHTRPPSLTFFLPDSRTIFCFAAGRLGDPERETGPGSERFQRVNADTGESRVLGPAPELLRPVGPGVLSADGKYVFVMSGRTSRLLHVIEAATGKEVASYLAPASIGGFTNTADGKHLLIAGDGGNILLRVPIRVILEGKPLTRKDLMEMMQKKP